MDGVRWFDDWVVLDSFDGGSLLQRILFGFVDLPLVSRRYFLMARRICLALRPFIWFFAGWFWRDGSCCVDPPAVMASALDWRFAFYFLLPLGWRVCRWFGATDLVVPPAAREFVCWARRPRGVPPSPRVNCISARSNTIVSQRHPFGIRRLPVN